jgi:hypothetical protein
MVSPTYDEPPRLEGFSREESGFTPAPRKLDLASRSSPDCLTFPCQLDHEAHSVMSLQSLLALGREWKGIVPPRAGL